MEKRYRLKDTELQMQLDKLTEYSSFTDALQQHKELERTADGFIRIEFGDYTSMILKEKFPVFSVWVHEDDIEEARYNPNTWNTYPMVLPPIGVPMRVIWANGEYGAAIFDHDLDFDDIDVWRNCLHGEPYGPARYFNDVYGMKFRPWEDEEEKDE